MSEVALDEIAVRVSLSLFGAVEIGPDGVTKRTSSKVYCST